MNIVEKEVTHEERLLRLQLTKCSSCSHNCQAKILAEYINLIGLEEFVKKQKQNNIPRDISQILSKIWLANSTSHNFLCRTTAREYDFLKPRTTNYIGKFLS